MILTDNPALEERLRTFRNHGITTDARTREEAGAWFYEMQGLGYNYRMTDIQAALGVSQMRKLEGFLARRRGIAARYDKEFEGTAVRPLAVKHTVEHAYHLYVVRIPDRDRMYERLRENGIFPQVHYIPVHLHPYYRAHLGTAEGLCPAAENAYREILSLPMYPDLTDDEQTHVITQVLEAS